MTRRDPGRRADTRHYTEPVYVHISTTKFYRDILIHLDFSGSSQFQQGDSYMKNRGMPGLGVKTQESGFGLIIKGPPRRFRQTPGRELSSQM